MNEESSQSGISLMGQIGTIETRLTAQAELQRELLEFAQELKTSVDLAHERISEVIEGLVKLGQIIGGPAVAPPPAQNPAGAPAPAQSPDRSQVS